MEAYELSPEEWALELHHMANAGFDDLYHVSIGVDPDGQPIVDLKTTITTAFGLVTDGMELQPNDLAPSLAKFLKAAESADTEKRSELMRLALANLSGVVGFAIGP